MPLCVFAVPPVKRKGTSISGIHKKRKANAAHHRVAGFRRIGSDIRLDSLPWIVSGVDPERSSKQPSHSHQQGKLQRERVLQRQKKMHTKSYCNDKRRLFGLQMTPNSLLWFSIAFCFEENINWTLIVWWPKFNIYNKDFVLAICYLSDFISITILIIVCESFYTQTPTSIVFPLKVLIELNALIWILLCKSSTRGKLI